MRIVSWNIQKGHKSTSEIAGLLEGWGADVGIFQEPTAGLLAASNAITSSRSSTTTWTANARRAAQGAQGHIVVLTAGNARAGAFSSHDVPGATQPNPLVVFTLTLGGESLRVATCHAPYGDGSSGEASQYVANAKLLLDSLATNGTPVDLWIGDVNTYGHVMPRVGNATYDLKLASPTGGKGDGGALDKIFARVGCQALANMSCGRIKPAYTVANPHQRAPNTGVADVTEATWTDASKIPSDHLPVYLDTGAQVQAVVTTPMPKRALFDDFPDPEPRNKRPKAGATS